MIVFDTETTGLLKPEGTKLHLQPFITELYACKFDEEFNITSEFQTFMKPPFPIPEFIQKLTGITDGMVEDAPTFIEIYDKLCEFFLGESISFAHNHSFDSGVLLHELERHDLQCKFPWPSAQMCTVELSTQIKNRRLKLGELYGVATGKSEIIGAHRAKTDVLATLECVKWLKNKGFW